MAHLLTEMCLHLLAHLQVVWHEKNVGPVTMSNSVVCFSFLLCYTLLLVGGCSSRRLQAQDLIYTCSLHIAYWFCL